jgi:hypothetical protein
MGSTGHHVLGSAPQSLRACLIWSPGCPCALKLQPTLFDSFGPSSGPARHMQKTLSLLAPRKWKKGPFLGGQAGFSARAMPRVTSWLGGVFSPTTDRSCTPFLLHWCLGGCPPPMPLAPQRPDIAPSAGRPPRHSWSTTDTKAVSSMMRSSWGAWRRPRGKP